MEYTHYTLTHNAIVVHVHCTDCIPNTLRSQLLEIVVQTAAHPRFYNLTKAALSADSWLHCARYNYIMIVKFLNYNGRRYEIRVGFTEQ